MTTPERSVRSVRFPAAYGAPGGPESLLPSISAHLSSEAEAIILEGTAEYVRSLHIPSPRHPRLLPRRNTRSTSPEMRRHSGRSGRSGPPRPLLGPSRASHEARLAGASPRDERAGSRQGEVGTRRLDGRDVAQHRPREPRVLRPRRAELLRRLDPVGAARKHHAA